MTTVKRTEDTCDVSVSTAMGSRRRRDVRVLRGDGDSYLAPVCLHGVISKAVVEGSKS